MGPGDGSPAGGGAVGAVVELGFCPLTGGGLTAPLPLPSPSLTGAAGTDAVDGGGTTAPGDTGGFAGLDGHVSSSNRYCCGASITYGRGWFSFCRIAASTSVTSSADTAVVQNTASSFAGSAWSNLAMASA